MPSRSAPPDEATFWEVRTWVYRHFAETTRPPTVEKAAERFGLDLDHARALWEELDRRHCFFLEPGTHRIRIANPFSAVPTPFRVRAAGRGYFANCAWDALGIPAALHADAEVEASCAESGEPIVLRVEGGRVSGPPAVAHFLVPFARWYENMIFT